MGSTSWVHLDNCDIIAVTETAVLIEYEGERHWMPLSQMPREDADRFAAGDEDVTVTVSDWIAKQKGIEVD